ncbi:MAG: ADYC domain-containing protein [Polyangia bacterium]
MRLQRVVSFLGSGLLFLASGCGHEDGPALTLDLNRLDSMQSNDDVVNGLTLNGLTLNGLTLNGLTLNGLTLNGLTLNSSATTAPRLASVNDRLVDLGKVSFSNITLGNQTLEDAAIDGATLVARAEDRTYRGSDLVGARLSGTLLNGTSVPLRIDDVKTDADGTVLYSVAVLSDNGPMPLCGTANGVPVPAVVVSGYWDKAASYVDEDDSFTFGCVNAAIGKCVRWGYKPWTTAQECRNNSCKTRKLSDWHRACVRLVRADYCGDGVSHTRNGTIINVYDQIGIQKSSNPGWEVEAEWGADGASCIRHTRWLQANTIYGETDLAYIQRVCPSRLAANNGPRCSLDKTTYNTQFGFNRSSDERPLVRNESPEYQ